MTKTGRRAGALRDLLQRAGVQVRQSSGSLRMADLHSGARNEALAIHAMLGGLSPSPTLRPGSWDMRTVDDLHIELDEEFHFTRYRAATLQRSTLAGLPWTPTHLAFCAAHEKAAARGGGRWTSASTEKMFGPSDAVGVYGGNGSARGKQRALYDAMKDVVAATGALRLARISIYDWVDGVTLGDILNGKRSVPPEAVRRAIESRVR